MYGEVTNILGGSISTTGLSLDLPGAGKSWGGALVGYWATAGTCKWLRKVLTRVDNSHKGHL